MRQLITCAALLAGFLVCSCTPQDKGKAASGPIELQYWDKWTGFEADAMKAVVDKYNASQSRVHVNYVSTSAIDQKLLVATAGGNPPDLAGPYEWNIVPYAEKDALLPLDRLMKRDGISLDSYLPAFAPLCQHRGYTWGLPTTPSSLALHYNTKLFREAGLDPKKPPRSIKGLNEYAEKLTKRDAKGNIIQLGFTPSEPGWWNPCWIVWFNGTPWKDGKTITCNSPEGLRTFEWIQSFPKKYGDEQLQSFISSAGQFASSENLFISGRVAMELQGVYLHNYITMYNPKLEWAAAPFPAESEDKKDVTLVQSDLLVIPKGSKHPEEAWDFLKFTQRRDNMELLCLLQKKFSPLKDTSPGFYATHPHPYVRLFRELAESPNAVVWPRMPMQSEYADELNSVFDSVFLMRETPKHALDVAEKRLQPKLDRANIQWDRIKDARLKEWAAE